MVTELNLEEEENSLLTTVAPLTDAHAVLHLLGLEVKITQIQIGQRTNRVDIQDLVGDDGDSDLWELLDDVVDLGRAKSHWQEL